MPPGFRRTRLRNMPPAFLLGVSYWLDVARYYGVCMIPDDGLHPDYGFRPVLQ